MLPALKDEKLYYSIGEIADMFGVSKSLIRYWESEFSILKPHKNSKGDRRFTKENIDQLQLIFDLVKNRGFTIEGAKNEIRQNKDLLKQKQAVLQKLIHLKNEMLRFKESLRPAESLPHTS
ncbi:MAG TPA: MerR family transcriptional regulator [Saprospiraceae bacterium]|nr:MerR family transcriptional regulator [Saprospiraceae bacterium]HNT21230.1 MerR family transcriptional regulator [Saprospiraceae bacterium]